MDILTIIAENRIREAVKNGELDNIPGRGRPLNLDDLSHVPEELRAGYILLRNAGVLPEEMQLKKEIVSLQKLINCCCEDRGGEKEIDSLRKKLTEKILRYDILMERRNRGSNLALGQYQNKIYKRLGGY
ncbi:MAG: DUF1992 domain-containing protein [Peptococcaceae bacterium]|nr:DUF1992 domain-containing protein [Peptococcaceae bacterium]